jgi:multidrug transporter EmrE-like cation transporter
MFLISLLAGFSNVGFIVLWTLAVRKNPYVTVDVAIIVGSIIPSVASAIFIPGYVFSYLKLIGFAFLIAAAVFMGKYTASTVKKITFSSIILVVLTGLSEGIFSFSQQLYKAFGKTDLYTEEVFGFYTYLLSAGILSVLIIFYFIFFIKKEDFVPTVKGFAKRTGSVVGLLFILAAFLYANSYFQTLATTVGKLDPQILYPVYRGSLLILAMILSRIIFKEKITVNSVIGIVCAIAGIVLMNLL